MSLFPAFQKLSDGIIQFSQVFWPEIGISAHFSLKLLNRLAAVKSRGMVHSRLHVIEVCEMAVIIPDKIQEIVGFYVVIYVIHYFTFFEFVLMLSMPEKSRHL